MKHVKAGWAEAPCKLCFVDGLKTNMAAMKVERIERDLDHTTFIGSGIFRRFERLVVPNEKYVGVLPK